MADETVINEKKSLGKKIKAGCLLVKGWVLDAVLKSWKGGAIGILAGLILYLCIIDTFINTGLGWYVDIPLALVLTGLIIFGLGYPCKFVFSFIKKIDTRFGTVVILTLIALNFLPLQVVGRLLVVLFFISGLVIGFSITRGWKKPASIILLIITAAINIYSVISVFGVGFDSTIPVSKEYLAQKGNTPLQEDPSLNGQYKVKYLTYGSGSDYRREEYGSRVNLKTKPVDATPFFDQSGGFYNYMRKIYWKFNSKNYPLNARVWYPDGNGNYPLVLIVHGNHLMTDYSDPGYEYLGKLLASRGFITASIDENFLNGSWIQDYQQSEVFTRGWLLLKHLEQWRKWNNAGGNPFTGKVDMNNIVLIGHSRGGAAVSVAASINKLKRYHADAKQEFDFNFGIKGIVQIAPNDPYNPQNEIPVKLKDINYLILQGGYDQDMSFFLGNRVYNRLKFTGDGYHFKSAIYIYKANHGQFNTSWGRKDYAAPLSWFLNLKPIMDGNVQRKIAKLYISAFVEASTKGKNEFISLFRDYRNAKNILPDDYYINQFEDSNVRYVADYEEDFDVTTASAKDCSIHGKNLKTWNENALYFRDNGSSQQNLGVYLAWDKKDSVCKNKTAEYSITLGDSTLRSLKLDGNKRLQFFVCNNKDDVAKVNFTIRLISKTDSTVVNLNEVFLLPPPLKTELTKWPSIYSINKNKLYERVLQLVEIPLNEFVKRNKAFKPEEIKEIKFVFDKTDAGEIFLDKVGFN